VARTYQTGDSPLGAWVTYDRTINAIQKGDKQMAANVLKRLAPAVLAFGIAGSGIGLGLGNATAWASTHAPKAISPKAISTVKVGDPCTKAELGKTVVKTIKSGKLGLVCKKSAKGFRWEIKPARKTHAKK
jgi:hypothetical protein